MRSPKRRDGGFTLIELMIVVVIIGILAAIAIPKFGQMSRAAKEGEAPAILKEIITLQERYFQKNDEFAAAIADLEGGAVIGDPAVYYEFDVLVAGTSVCAFATPNSRGIDAGVSPQSMDMDRVLYRTANCT